MKRISQFAGLALLGLALAACNGKADGGDESGVGLPNPAATFCEEQGGSYNLETGECHLADGSTVDAWEHFRAQGDGEG